MKLFAVEYGTTVLVWAHDRTDAELKAEQEGHQISTYETMEAHAQESITTFPAARGYGYDLDSCVYGDPECRTVGQLLDLMEAQPVKDTQTLPLFGEEKK